MSECKNNVSSWETVAGYAVDCGESLCDVEVQVGQAGGLWFIRTTDDAEGGDDCDSTAYSDRDEAVAAAEQFASDHDETPDLDTLLAEVAESRGWDLATARRVAGEIVAIPDHSGMRLDVFASGCTSLVSQNVYRYDPDVAFDSYYGASSPEDAAMRLLIGGD